MASGRVSPFFSPQTLPRPGLRMTLDAMGILDGRKRGRRKSAPDPLSALYGSCFALDPALVVPVEAQAVFEPGEVPWKAMAALLADSESTAALVFFRGDEVPGVIQALTSRLGLIAGPKAPTLVRRFPAEAWRLELEHRRMGSLRCLMEKGGGSALILDEGLARAIEAPAGSGGQALPAGEPNSIRLDHPALLRLPALFCPRQWSAASTRAAVSWIALRASPLSRDEALRWTAAWTTGPEAARGALSSRMGFFFELRPPRAAQAEAVAKAIEPVLAAAWKEAWPGLCAILPGISAPAFGPSPTKTGKAELSVDGLLLAGAATLELSLLLPAPLLRLLSSAAEAVPGAAASDVEASPITRFLEVNDGLIGPSILAGNPAPAGPGPVEAQDSLPNLPSLLELFGSADLARLIQGYFLPEHGALGFQALFFSRKEAEPAGEGGARQALANLPFDERRIIASLPEAAREEWIEARKAGLPLVQEDREKSQLAGEESLKGLWQAHRKGRLELGHGGKSLLTACLGERIEAVDRGRLASLVSRDLPLAMLDNAGRVLARRVLDRLSAKDLAVATWGAKGKRPLLETNLSRGKRAELAAEASVLARRLTTGEEAPGKVVEAREELAQRMAGLLESQATEDGASAAPKGGRNGRPRPKAGRQGRESGSSR